MKALLILALIVPAERPIVELELSSQCGREHVAVYASGYAHFDVENSCGTEPEGSGLRRISGVQLRKLRSVISSAKFESLPESIEPDPHSVVTDADVFTIRVWQNGVVKQVRGFGLERAVDQNASRRFQAVWAAIEKFGSEGR